MRYSLMCIGLAIPLLGVVAWAAPGDIASLARVVGRLDALFRVTESPHPMADTTIVLCRAPDETEVAKVHAGHVKPAYCHVYVSEEGKEPMLTGKGAYPRGCVVVKTKLASEQSTDVMLYTVMRKMEAGYDAKHGDWEYSVLDGPSQRILARGRIDSCIECHEQHASTDYVTRAYVK
jgi:hypothetical protein